ITVKSVSRSVNQAWRRTSMWIFEIEQGESTEGSIVVLEYQGHSHVIPYSITCQVFNQLVVQCAKIRCSRNNYSKPLNVIKGKPVVIVIRCRGRNNGGRLHHVLLIDYCRP